MSSKIYLIGDLIIDQTWLVNAPADDERFAAHYDVLPRDMIDPSCETKVAGGIATIARVLSANGHASTVMTGWGTDGDPQIIVQKDKHIAWRKISSLDYTPVITRIYERGMKGVKMINRFDRDANANKKPVISIDKSKLVAGDIIVAGDYMSVASTSVLSSPEVKSWLISQPKKIPILLRSPNKSVIENVPWRLLLLNGHQLCRAFGLESFDGPPVRAMEGSCIYHPLLLKAIEGISGKYFSTASHPNRFILLYLEKDGLLLIDKEEITPILLDCARPDWQGVGATNMLLAHVALGIMEKKKYLNFINPSAFTLRIIRKQLSEICGKAITVTNDFSLNALKIPKTGSWCGPDISPTIDVHEKSKVGYKDSVKWNNELEKYDNLQKPQFLLKNGIELHWASWYLIDYLTVDEKFGREIVRIKKRIEDFLKTRSKRPFVAALCGEPGAGKSALAEKIGDAVKCEVIISNAAQWSSVEDLFWLFERVRSVHMRNKPCLVFIDEVDSDVAGEKLYGKLLAPLWDSSYSIRGDERALGIPTIFLLAGSDKNWADGDKLLEYSRKPSIKDAKLRDLVSRLTTAPVTIPPLVKRKPDLIYLAAWHFLKQNPMVESIQEGVLKLLVDSKGIQHGVRSVTKVVELFKRQKDPLTVATSDFPKAAYSELSLQISNPCVNWKLMIKPVKVSLWNNNK